MLRKAVDLELLYSLGIFILDQAHWYLNESCLHEESEYVLNHNTEVHITTWHWEG